MFCSAVIPTIDRTSLSRAVESVLHQSLKPTDYEIIVVNDSGRPLHHRDWMKCNNVKIIDTNCRNRSVARNAGAAMAKGDYLHFLDDDDWITPESYQRLRVLSEHTGAAWLIGGYRLTDNAGNKRKDVFPCENGNCLVQTIAAEWFSLQASLIQQQPFHEAAGFTSLYELHGGYEDTDLARKIMLRHEVASIPELVAVIRTGLEGSTTDFSNIDEQGRISRERILDQQATRRRLIESARAAGADSSYWTGQLLWVYLASAKWNVHHHRWLIATSRICDGCVCTLSQPRAVTAAGFWTGATHSHVPRWVH